MDEQDLLALRFPSRVPVRFEVLETNGKHVPGGPWQAQGVDVSRTGVRIESGTLPAPLLKRLGDYEAELRMEVSFDVAGLDLPVVGVCRWLKNFGEGRYILGVEYLDLDKSRGGAIAQHFEKQYIRPKVRQVWLGIGGIFAVFAIALMLGAWERQRAAMAAAEEELQAAIESKESLAILISELENRLSPANASPELAKEIIGLRKELETVRKDVGKKSVRLAQFSSLNGVTGSPATMRLERGDDFFSAGNMAAALIEYERATEIDPRLAEPYLKMGIVHEFQERPLKAMEAYGRYLDLRKDAPDWYEVSARVGQLYATAAAAQVPAIATTAPSATPAKAAASATPSSTPAAAKTAAPTATPAATEAAPPT